MGKVAKPLKISGVNLLISWDNFWL